MPSKIQDRIAELESQCATCSDYLDENVKARHWHNVETAAATLRNYETEIRALRWVLGNV